MDKQLTDKERKLLFWASFLALATAGFGFAFRVIHGGSYGAELGLDNHQIGQIFGASLWPIAITMILGSLVVDKIGYKGPMFAAFALQAASAIGTATASSYGALYGFAILAGLGHGIVECVINPVCATIYHNQKTKMLTILHAAWPVGLAAAGALIIVTDGAIEGLSWKVHSLWMLIPALAYAFMFFPCRFPVDERVKAGVPYSEMLKQVGFLGAFLASFMLVYEIGNQIDQLTSWTKPGNWFVMALGIGLAIGAVFGGALKAVGQPIFFLFCLMMIPLATAELGTDQWIGKLMRPVLEGFKLNPAWALVISASIMMTLRFTAGGVLKIFSPPALLAVSGIFSAAGLYWLSGSAGLSIFVAFVLYAVGQTFYWPCVLGFVAERYPKGGALTLNTVSAIGLLSVGIIGGQLLGISFDKSIHVGTAKELPAVAEASSHEKSFLGMKHTAIDAKEKDALVKTLPEAEQKTTNETYTAIETRAGRDVLKYAAYFPIMLVICFGAVALWFKANGGYKPVELDDAEPVDEAEAEPGF
ncbi:MAG: MFS transporter [Akkermansiaceae bacterium]